MNSSRRAFSLIEALVVLVVTATMLGVLLPALGVARIRATQAVCLSSMRQAWFAGHWYTVDHDDVYPNFGPPERKITGYLGGEYLVGVPKYKNHSRAWAYLLPEYGQSSGWPEHLMCPRQPRGSSDEVPQPFVSYLASPFDFPCYWMSDAMFYSPASLSEGRTLGDVRFASVRVSDAIYTSRKLVLHETVAFCLPRHADPWVELGHCYLFPTSVSFVDGHAERRVLNETNAGVLGVGCPPDGIRGRDFD